MPITEFDFENYEMVRIDEDNGDLVYTPLQQSKISPSRRKFTNDELLRHDETFAHINNDY